MSRLFLLAAALFAISTGYAPVCLAYTCNECTESIATLRDYLLQQSQLEFEMVYLQSVCDSLEYPLSCQDKLSRWWPGMLQGFLDYPETPRKICGDMDMCPKTDLQNDCERCVLEVAVGGLYMGTDTFENFTMAVLKSDVFCMGPDFGHAGMVVDCQNFIDYFIPPALEALQPLILGNPEEICNAVKPNMCQQ